MAEKILWGPDGKTKVSSNDYNSSTGEHFADLSTVDVFQEFLNVLPDPDKVLRKTGQGIQVLNDLLGDQHLEAVESIRTAAVAGAAWDLEPGDGGKATEAFKQFSKVLSKIDIPNVIMEMQKAVGFGFSPLEIIWVQDGKYWNFLDIVGKPPEWFLFTKERKLALKKGLFSHEEVPANRFLLVQHKASFNNPYGQRQLSKCYWPVTFRKNGWKWWTMFLEKFGSAFIFGKYPLNASRTKQAELLNALKGLAASAVGIAPENSNIEIKEAAGKKGSSSIHEDFIRSCNGDISKVWLGQNFTTEMSKNGSYAAGKVYNLVREDLTLFDMRRVAAAFNRLAQKYTLFNFGENIPAPVFYFEKQKEIKKEQADRDKTLYALGVRFKKSYVSREYDIPEGDFEIVEEKKEAKPEKDQSTDDSPKYQFSKERKKVEMNVFKSFVRWFKKKFSKNRTIETAEEFTKKKEETKVEMNVFKSFVRWFKKKFSKNRTIETAEEFTKKKEETGQKTIDKIIKKYRAKVEKAETFDEAFGILLDAHASADYDTLAGIVNEIRYTTSQTGGAANA